MATDDTPGRRVSAAREKAGVNRAALARMIGLSYSRLSDIEVDRKPPTLETLYEIAVALRRRPSELDGRLTARRPA